MIQTYHWTGESARAILLAMIAQPYQLYVERRDPRRNMARFYSLSIEETLFGQARLVRRWGRIGTTGRTVQHSFDSESEAVRLFLELLKLKRMRGYQPRRILDPAHTSGSHASMTVSIDNSYELTEAPPMAGPRCGQSRLPLGRDQMSCRPSWPSTSTRVA